MMNSLQKAGGVAALIMAATFVVAFAVFLAVLMPAGYFDEGIAAGRAGAEKAGIIADNQAMASIGYLIPYVVFGLFLVVLSLALYDRLKAGVPATARVATAVGLLWAGLVIASGLIATLGIRAVGELYGTDPAQAGVVWAAVEIVVSGLGGETWEILGGTWLLLIGWATLRTRQLPRALGYLALVLGVAGLLTVFPLLEPAVFVFGVGFIVWLVWLGIVILRGREGQKPAGEVKPATA
jgi:hypothetical protein